MRPCDEVACYVLKHNDKDCDGEPERHWLIVCDRLTE